MRTASLSAARNCRSFLTASEFVAGTKTICLGFYSDTRRSRALEKFRDFCTRNNLPNLKSFVDRQSARNADERPAFQQMLTYCQKNKKNISSVVVADLSRLAR